MSIRSRGYIEAAQRFDAMAGLYEHLCRTGDKPVPGLGSEIATPPSELVSIFSDPAKKPSGLHVVYPSIIHATRYEDGQLVTSFFYTPRGEIVEPQDPRLDGVASALALRQAAKPALG